MHDPRQPKRASRGERVRRLNAMLIDVRKKRRALDGQEALILLKLQQIELEDELSRSPSADLVKFETEARDRATQVFRELEETLGRVKAALDQLRDETT